MITLVQKVVRYAIGGNQSETLEETLRQRPKLEDFVVTNHSGPETKEFEGLVTSIDSSCIVIDQDVYCDPSNLPSNNKVRLGVKVRGLAERGGKHEMWRTKTVEVVEEEWGTALHTTGKDDDKLKHPTNNGQAISCKDLAEGIPGILKRDLLSSVSSRSCQPRSIQECTEGKGGTKTVIGKVTGVYGDILTLNNAIHFTLTDANCNMDLTAGDWIVCDVDGNNGVNGEGGDGRQGNGTIQVSSLKPLRKKRVRGEVTHSYRTHIIINEEVSISDWEGTR